MTLTLSNSDKRHCICICTYADDCKLLQGLENLQSRAAW